MGYGGFEPSGIPIAFVEGLTCGNYALLPANAREFALSFVAELLLESVFLSVDPYMRYIFFFFLNCWL